MKVKFEFIENLLCMPWRYFFTVVTISYISQTLIYIYFIRSYYSVILILVFLSHVITPFIFYSIWWVTQGRHETECLKSYEISKEPRCTRTFAQSFSRDESDKRFSTLKLKLLLQYLFLYLFISVQVSFLLLAIGGYLNNI